MEMKAILFDLGGVLVDWDGTIPLIELTHGRITKDQARRFWLESEWVRRFEAGQCTAEAFAAGCVEELELTLSPEQFIVKFATWDKGPFNGAAQILDELKPRLRLYCLSNNNRIHWKNEGIQSLVKRFDQTFVSFETGTMKPDPQAFTHVLEHVPEDAQHILFLDDNPECIDAALQRGFQSKVVKGLTQLTEILITLDCLRRD